MIGSRTHWRGGSSGQIGGPAFGIGGQTARRRGVKDSGTLEPGQRLLDRIDGLVRRVL